MFSEALVPISVARTHDGVCHRHGADAAQRLRDEPALQQRLAEAGLTAADYPAIEAAVTAHSAPKEVSREHPHWPLIALLKDADGLDRVRLGDLDPRYLRHPESKGMVPFAQALFAGWKSTCIQPIEQPLPNLLPRDAFDRAGVEFGHAFLQDTCLSVMARVAEVFVIRPLSQRAKSATSIGIPHCSSFVV